MINHARKLVVHGGKTIQRKLKRAAQQRRAAMKSGGR